MKLIGVLVSKNEESKIKYAIESMLFMDEIILVDNRSTDKTIEIASNYNKVRIINVDLELPHPAGIQRNIAIESITDKDCFIYFSDCDEIITSDLKNEILTKISDSDIDVYKVPRINYFLGKPLMHGGWYPDYQIRLIRKSALYKWVLGPLHLPQVLYKNAENSYLYNEDFGPHDKPILIDGSKISLLVNPYIHLSHTSINAILEKTVRFHNSEVKFFKKFLKEYKPTTFDLAKGFLFNFCSRYFLKKGFLDGFNGFIASMFVSFSLMVLELRKWEELKENNVLSDYKNIFEKYSQSNDNK